MTGHLQADLSKVSLAQNKLNALVSWRPLQERVDVLLQKVISVI